MFEIKENFSLKKYNTFGIDVKTKYFVEYSTLKGLSYFLDIHRKPDLPIMLLGGGSNVLFTKNFEGYILHPNIKGIEVVKENSDNVWLRVGAGEDWDEFVGYCVSNDWGGVENLSLIPGNVGTCPIQNIGAYGVEVKDVITEVETINIESLQKTIFKNSDCQFGYRDSIFKRDLKAKHIINYVSFCLSKKQVFKLDYGNLNSELEKFDHVNLQNIRNAVINIRDSKLPKPEEIGNAGSFFKNPVVQKSMLDDLLKSYSDMPYYLQGSKFVKIPAGWLIEHTGWKGEKIGNVGVHEKQALVLINHGDASGKEVVDLAQKIQKSVKEKFGIDIEMEVNIV